MAFPDVLYVVVAAGQGLAQRTDYAPGLDAGQQRLIAAGPREVAPYRIPQTAGGRWTVARPRMVRTVRSLGWAKIKPARMLGNCSAVRAGAGAWARDLMDMLCS